MQPDPQNGGTPQGEGGGATTNSFPGSGANSRIAEWACWYADHGWPVIPLHAPETAGGCSCGDPECASPAKHPRTMHGLADATTDVALVAAWWERWPTANIGLRTGVEFDVADLDGEIGEASLDAWWAATLPDVMPNLGGGLIVATGGGGQHWYGRVTGAGNRAGLFGRASHVDWRGCGGYVVAPPSLHVSGQRYSWLNDVLASMFDWPAELVALVTGDRRVSALPVERPALLDPGRGDATAYGLAALKAACGTVASAATGGRNHALNAEAFSIWRLVGGGQLTEGLAESWLAEAGLRCGLGRVEVLQTIRSARAGLNDPRRPERDR